MTIQKADYSISDQEEIQRWVDEVIPQRITNLGNSVIAQTDQLAVVQTSEDIFKQTYDSFATVMRDGFLKEIEGLNGDGFSDPTLDEARVIQAAENPLSVPELFPPFNIQIEPTQSIELTADTGSFDVTSNSGALPGPPTGFNEAQALGIELIELLLAFPVLGLLIDAWLAEEAALLKEIAALGVLGANVLPGQPGEANIALALADANVALAAVQALIAVPSTSPPGRTAYIAVRLAEIAARATQITDAGTGDKNFYRDERYFWLNKRINLRYGSLSRLKSIERNINDLNEEIANLTAELAFYTSIGF